MELSKLLTEQVIIIFILIGVGFILKKIGMITQTGTKQFTNILLMIVTPCVLINAYQKEFRPELAMNLLWAALFSLIFHIVMIVISTLIFRKEPTGRYRINIFASIYSNCGFMAIPLLSAVLGDDGVFYGSAYLALFNIMSWTHGIALYGGGLRNMSIKKAVLNPGVIGTLISMFFFFLNIRLPKIIIEPVRYMAGLNTPLAMIILGTFLANIDFKKTLIKLSIYGVSFMRLLFFPVVAILIIRLMRLDSIVGGSVLIGASCPTAATCTLFSARFGLDSEYASELVSLTTIFSIITIPLVMLLA